MTRRRALMLVSQDAELQRIAAELVRERAALEEHVASLQRQADEYGKGYKERTERLRQDAVERVRASGVTVFDRKNHEITLDEEEGVVWAESKEGCGCPFCMLSNLFSGRKR